MIVGYKLVDSQGVAVQQWGGVYGITPSIPNPITLANGDVVCGPVLDCTYDDCTLVAWEMDPPPPVVPDVITRRQCAIQLLALGMITGPEAVAMTRDGTPPAAVQAYLSALPEEELVLAEIDVAATNYYRSNPLLAALMVANGSTPEQLDQFFLEAAAR